MVLDVHAVFFGEALEEVARHPHLVSGLFGALAEDLEFPLAFRHFGIDAFVVDAGEEAKIEMLFDHLAGDVADVLVADAGVIGALRRRIASLRKAERTAVLVEEIFLLETEPRAGIVENGRALVRNVRGAIRHHDFAHDERAVGARAVRIDRDGLEHAIRTVAFSLVRRGTVKTPQRQLLKCRENFEFLDLRFAAQTRHWRIAVEPYVLELVLCHHSFLFTAEVGKAVIFTGRRGEFLCLERPF